MRTSGIGSHDSHSPVAKDIQPRKPRDSETPVDGREARKERENSNEHAADMSTGGSSESDYNKYKQRKEREEPNEHAVDKSPDGPSKADYEKYKQRKEREESNAHAASKSTVGSSESGNDEAKSDDNKAASKEDHKKTKDDETEPKEEKDKSKDWDKEITTRNNYRTKPPDAMEVYLLGKGQLLVKHLNSKQRLPDYYVDKIPKLFFNEDKTCYVITLTGVPAHHKELEQVLERISHLSFETERLKNDCKHELTKTAESVIQILTKRIRPVSENLKHYTEYFLRILKDEKQHYAEQFDEYITDKSKLLTDRTITDDKFDPRPELKKAMEQYEKSKSFTYELEKIKHGALDEFIEQQIYLPRQQFERKPTNESLKVLNDFIEENKKEMKTNNDYKGLEVRPFKLISKLLQAISIYNRCFQLQLPLFESAPVLLKMIHENTVVTISTSTGSGRWTEIFTFVIHITIHNSTFR